MEWVRPFSGFAWGAIGWDRVYCEGMRDTDLFQLALGLQSPWTVTRSEFAVEDGRLDLYVDFPRGSRFACADADARVVQFTTRRTRRGGIWTSSSMARCCTLV